MPCNNISLVFLAKIIKLVLNKMCLTTWFETGNRIWVNAYFFQHLNPVSPKLTPVVRSLSSLQFFKSCVLSVVFLSWSNAQGYSRQKFLQSSRKVRNAVWTHCHMPLTVAPKQWAAARHRSVRHLWPDCTETINLLKQQKWNKVLFSHCKKSCQRSSILV